jgi:hypothetical protein
MQAEKRARTRLYLGLARRSRRPAKGRPAGEVAAAAEAFVVVEGEDEELPHATRASDASRSAAVAGAAGRRIFGGGGIAEGD